MTVPADGVVAGGSAARVSGRGPARAAAVEHLSRADRMARGKDARAVASLESQAEFSPGPGRDPVGLLLGQAASRVPELVPVRHGRMLVSPFTFYRGAALPMAADLAGRPPPGCGCSCAATPPVQFRRVRLAGAQPGLRRQRLRRDPARAVRVGRQAAGGEPGRGRTGQRVHRQGRAQDRPGGGRTLPHRDARVRGAALPGRLVRVPGPGWDCVPFPGGGRCRCWPSLACWRPSRSCGCPAAAATSPTRESRPGPPSRPSCRASCWPHWPTGPDDRRSPLPG